MEQYKLRVVHDTLQANARLTLVPAVRVLYCRSGSVTVVVNGSNRILEEDTALAVTEAVTVETASSSAVVWRWEAVPIANDDSATLSSAAGVHSELRGSYPVPLKDGENYAIRCDRVAFPPGGAAYTHTHAAPGVRCQHTGELFIDSLGHEWTAKPGETWLERGPDHVFAQAWDKTPAHFIRVMLIPEPYWGRSTISYMLPEDADKPKLQQYHRYVEQPVQLK
jgi:hypothetical protein